MFTGAYGGSESAPAALARIEHYLEQPRKRLTYTINGTTILDVAALESVTGTGDVNNGPFPEVLSVVRVDGGAAIWVEFRVTAHVRKCPGGPVQTYLSNRWMETLTIDDECRTTRTRQGDIVLRSDFQEAPDSFRGLVTPPIPTGFIRESSRYALQKDGLRIQYEFVDKEAYFLPPYGSFKASGTYKETCSNGATRFAEVQVSLTGDVRSNRRQLLAMAISIAVQRLDRSGIARADKTGRWLATGAFEEDLYNPKVSVQLRAMLKPGPAVSDGAGTLRGTKNAEFNALAQRFDNAANRLGQLEPGLSGAVAAARGRLDSGLNKTKESVSVPGKPSLLGGGWGELPFGSVQGLSPDPGIRGTAGLTLLAAALNDPCLSQAIIDAELTAGRGSGGPILSPQNADPGASTGGGAGQTTPAPNLPGRPIYEPFLPGMVPPPNSIGW